MPKISRIICLTLGLKVGTYKNKILIENKINALEKQQNYNLFY